jgi:4-amino-4-deoxy-L-arabinose transferase-like glycosyltransferase
MSAWRRALVVIGAAALVRLLFAALIPLFPDETYYWEWSRRLAPGYFDHPGGVALLIRIGTALLSPFGAAETPIGVRFGIIVAGWIAALATIATARRIAGASAALRAAILISVLPLAAAGLIIATPDVPVLAATAVALYLVVRAIQSPVRSRESLMWWIAAGVALGLAFSSKYTSIFIPVGVVAAVVLRKELRARLAEPGPYIACIVATLVFVPVLVWNSHHDWISFLFQLKHGLAKPQGSALHIAWRNEGDFWGGQAGLASPILFVMMGIAVWRGERRAVSGERFVLSIVALVSFGFFVYSALRQRVEPNWPAPAYIPAIVLLATTTWGALGERWMKAGIWFAAIMSAIIYVQGVVPILPLPPRKDPIARAFGWRELTLRADSAAAAITAQTGKRAWLGGDRYQEASELAFHTPSHPETFATNLSGRVNQYELWPKFAERATAGDNVVLVLDDSEGQHDAVKALAPYFADVHRGELVTMRRGSGEIGTRRVWTLVGWRGGWPVVR